MNGKEQAARRALDFVHDGMRLGLGSGTTATVFIDLLGQALKEGRLHDIAGAPTSEASAEHAKEAGIPLTSLSDCPMLDLAIDGADEIDPRLDLIKGLGRALLREKIIEIHAQRFLVIAEATKLVPRLGTRVPLPVEIVQFEKDAHLRWLNGLASRAELALEADGSPVVTDNGNFLAFCYFEDGISEPYELAFTLGQRPGIVEHGLFLGMADAAIIAGPEGVTVMERNA